ncbi:MAG: MFS transporter [Alphaproteobacteria bacterium]|nr:MFS transporter [Alphaproteobacteria bacterium]
MAQDLGWSRTVVYGGFSWALLVMGVVSAAVGRAIDRHGGRPVMLVGSLTTALGCLVLATAHHWGVFFLAWTVLGIAMRLTLYDAAFATLTRILGQEARRPISQITLLGGLASTVFWPLGMLFADWWGWRGTAVAYAGIALLVTVPLHWLIPRAPRNASPAEAISAEPTRPAPHRFVGLLFAIMVALIGFLASAMSAHMVSLLIGLGLATSVAVGLAALRGVGQTSARLAEVLFGARLHPAVLGILAAVCLPLGMVAGGLSAWWTGFGAIFALIYGAGNGLATIVRGALPLFLFGASGYGARVGRLVAPSFVVAAAAPAVLAQAMETGGPMAGILVALAAALGVLAAMLGLAWLARRPATR